MAKKKQIERINFLKQFQLHKACADDDLRPVMNHIFFHNGYAYATNAHIAVKAKLDSITNFPPEQLAMLEGYLLHSKHYEMILKADFAEVEKVTDKETGTDTVQFRVWGDNKTSFIVPLIKETEGFRYPNCDKAVFDNPCGGVSVPAIGFNYGLLGLLKAAMGIKTRMEMHFSGNGKLIEIVSAEIRLDYDVRGMLMSVMIDD